MYLQLINNCWALFSFYKYGCSVRFVFFSSGAYVTLGAQINLNFDKDSTRQRRKRTFLNSAISEVDDMIYFFLFVSNCFYNFVRRLRLLW